MFRLNQYYIAPKPEDTKIISSNVAYNENELQSWCKHLGEILSREYLERLGQAEHLSFIVNRPNHGILVQITPIRH